MNNNPIKIFCEDCNNYGWLDDANEGHYAEGEEVLCTLGKIWVAYHQENSLTWKCLSCHEDSL